MIVYILLCLLLGDDSELSNPPNVSALLGNVGKTYVTLWCSPTELALRDKFVPESYNEQASSLTF